MVYLPYRRRPLQRLGRVLAFFLCAWLLIDLLAILRNHRVFSRNLVTHTYTDPSLLPTAAQKQRIFIVAAFWTNAYIIQQRWGQALLDLVGVLGKENIYISIYESGSLDNTKEMLQLLDDVLGANNVPRTFVLDPTTHEDEIAAGPLDEEGRPRDGWILSPEPGAGKEMRRIPYLARLRNENLRPLFELKAQGIEFDKILFLNDVVFRPSDVLSLLATNAGSYSVACALDFNAPPAYYDTFALRDILGGSTIMPAFPYFGAADSRESMLAGLATKVTSCWNGLVLMDSAPFYEGLRFRALSDSLASMHLEASECCLIHTDMVSQGLGGGGIYINPAVRVAYSVPAYSLTHRDEDGGFVSGMQYVTGVWINRLMRLLHGHINKTVKLVDKRFERWKMEGANSLEKREETGQICAIDESHMLIWNGWKHV